METVISTDSDKKNKTVQLSDKVYRQVRAHGNYGDSFSNIVERIVSDWETRLAGEEEAARGVF